MNILATVERLERMAAKRQEAEQSFCTCPEPPIIRIVPVSADGTEYQPTEEAIRAATAEKKAGRGEICPLCGNPYRPGALKMPAVVIGNAPDSAELLEIRHETAQPAGGWDQQ